jgi:hypothetical protein
VGTSYQASQKAASAPDIEPAMYDALFKGSTPRLVLGGQYGPGTVLNVKDGSAYKGAIEKAKDGEQFNKLEWAFQLLDSDGDVLEAEFGDDGIKPVQVEKLTGHGFNTASKTVPGEIKVLKALLTPAEYAAFEEGEAVDEDALIDRKVQVEVFIKEGGWPGVGNIVPGRKATKSATKARQAVEE